DAAECPSLPAVQQEITRRLRLASARGVELVSLESLPNTPGWKRILFDLAVSQASDAELQLELSVRELELKRAPEATDGESPDGKANDESSRESYEGELAGETSSRTGPLAAVLPAMAWEITRRIESLSDLHFDAAQRFFEAGKHDLAIEEYVRFL